MKGPLKEIWLKAAVAGGIWASFEIIVGSMLHNLHIPFSGTILASLSIVLMMAFLQIWNESGLIWRAGLICGLMKSLSPSAVILGPMTGIMMEAFFMEIMIVILGRNLGAYLLGGIAAMLSTILHKLASLFILYGSDLVSIYLNLFRFIQKQMGMADAEPSELIAWILMVYMLIGSLAALLGTWLGKRAKKEQMPLEAPVLSEDPFLANWADPDPRQKFRMILLLLHLLMIPAMLVLINLYGLKAASLLPAGIYLAFLLLYYKRIKFRLLKPFFWSQLILMTVLAGLFWHPVDPDSQALPNGWLVGLEMSLRAVLIVSTFSAFSVEIRNPLVTNALSKIGSGSAYAALSLAFNSLPAMLDRSADIKAFLRRPLHSFLRLIREAELWLACYETHLKG